MYRICLYQGTHSTSHTSVGMGIAICSNMQGRKDMSERAVSKISYCLKSKGRFSFAEIFESFINFLRSLSKPFDIQIILFLKGLSCYHHSFFLSSIVNWSNSARFYFSMSVLWHWHWNFTSFVRFVVHISICLGFALEHRVLIPWVTGHKEGLSRERCLRADIL